jgi:hypothetical protein
MARRIEAISSGRSPGCRAITARNRSAMASMKGSLAGSVRWDGLRLRDGVENRLRYCKSNARPSRSKRNSSVAFQDNFASASKTETTANATCCGTCGRYSPRVSSADCATTKRNVPRPTGVARLQHRAFVRAIHSSWPAGLPSRAHWGSDDCIPYQLSGRYCQTRG